MPTRALIASQIQTAVEKDGLQRPITEDAVFILVVLQVRIIVAYDTKDEPSEFWFLPDNNTTATVVQPLNRSSCLSRHPS